VPTVVEPANPGCAPASNVLCQIHRHLAAETGAGLIPLHPTSPKMLAITWKRRFLDSCRPSSVCAGRVPGAEGDQKGRSNGFDNHKSHTLDGVTTPSMAAA